MQFFLNTIILLGALQGIIASSILFLAKQNKQANKLLAFMLFFMALACLNLFAKANNWLGIEWVNVIFYFIPTLIVMPIGPLLYFYVQSNVNLQFKINRKEKLQFCTVVIDLVPCITTLIFFIGSFTKLISYNTASWGNFIDTYNIYSDIPRWISLAFYTWYSYKTLGIFKPHNTSVSNNSMYNWLKQLVMAMAIFAGIWLLYLIPYLIPDFTFSLLRFTNWYPVYIPLVVLIYWVGIKAILAQAFHKNKTNNSNTLTPQMIEATVAAITKAMKIDKEYLDTELSLAVLSAKVGIPQKTISAVLNQGLQQNFNQFVNTYRLQEFKNKVIQSDVQHLTIAGIAAQCGFSSQASFQRIFKEMEGVSPSVYLKNVKTTT